MATMKNLIINIIHTLLGIGFSLSGITALLDVTATPDIASIATYSLLTAAMLLHTSKAIKRAKACVQKMAMIKTTAH